ncbi:hypothetical protein NMG60_11001590 [Bertholletia excelsa]
MTSSIVKRCFSSLSPLDPSENLVSTVVSILKHHRSKSRWNEIRSLYPAGFTPSEASQITRRLRNTPHLALNFFLFTQRNRLCNHTLLSYSTIIHTLSRSRLKSPALSLIQSALRQFPDNTSSSTPNAPKIFETLVKTYRECDSAPFVFDLLIKACLRSNRVDEAIKIARMLRSRDISPTVSTCNSLIRSVARSCGSHASYDLYREVFGFNTEIKSEVCRVKVVPNVHTFNIIMLAFYQDGLIKSVREVWGEMARFDIVEPDAYSYSILMATHCEEGKMEEAVKLWDQMEMKGLKHDVVAYNTMIDGFCTIGEVGRAEDFFRGMGLNGVESSSVTFEHLINGYCQNGDVDSAILLYKDMCSAGLRPEGSIIDAIVSRLCSGNRAWQAMEFLTVAVRKYEFAPKIKSYELIIKGLCQEGRIEEALKLQAEMVGRGFGPNLEIYNSFIDAYNQQGNAEMAGLLKKEMLETQMPTKEN